MKKKLFYAKLVLQGRIADSPARMPWFARRTESLLQDLVEALEFAARHPRVRKLLIVVRSLEVGWAQIEEIHSALAKVRQAGKETLVLLEGGGNNRTIYLASGASKVLVPPSASVDLVGLRSEKLYLRGLFDYLGITPQILAVGEFKSAGEMFTRHCMSEPHQAMVGSILADFQSRLISGVAQQAKLDPDQVRELIDDGPYSARRALQEGLISGISYEDEITAQLESETPPLAPLPLRRLRRRKGLLRRVLGWRRPRIAQITVEGIIAYGESDRGLGRGRAVGSSGLIDRIRAARKSRRVKAVLVRINSPGGSAVGSDLVWRELKITDQEKPVIVSLGDAAASGGYMVALAGRRIIADPSTLTGSIGVLGGKLSIRDLLHRLHLTVDSAELGRHAGYASAARPFSEREVEILQEQMSDLYENSFLPRVAEARRKPMDEIRSLAGGRVWTGAQAHELGLVDELGGFSVALEAARTAAGLRPGKFRLVTLQPRRRLLDWLPFGLEAGSVPERILLFWLDRIQIH